MATWFPEGIHDNVPDDVVSKILPGGYAVVGKYLSIYLMQNNKRNMFVLGSSSLEMISYSYDLLEEILTTSL